jgi:hypothetical protein
LTIEHCQLQIVEDQDGGGAVARLGGRQICNLKFFASRGDDRC